jgi:hypothetical protein
MTKKLTKKEAVLKFLQDEALTLRAKVPNLIEALCEEDQLVLVTTKELAEVPQFTYENVKLNVSVRVGSEPEKTTAALSGAANKANEIRKRHGVVPLESLIIPSAKNAIGPDGTGERRNQSSIDAWKKRFNK